MTNSLPKFDRPPVVETVIGVEFDPLTRWQITHFGLFWNKVRSRYDHSTVQPPLPQQIETFESKANVLTINLTPQPEVRCWFVEGTNQWLLQLQNNRFLSNWKKNLGVSEYPNYEGFKDRFKSEWKEFLEFVSDEKIGEPKVLQVEVSYINHIEVSFGFDRLSEIFPVWRGLDGTQQFLETPEAVAFTSAFVIPENRGRLHIQMQPVFRHADIRSVLQLSITAKIRIDESNDFETCVDKAHEWVVRSFVDITSGQLHEAWNRTQ